jgi:hypothetical protein
MARTVSGQRNVPARKQPYPKELPPTRDRPQGGVIAVDVVGPAKDQCYKFEVKSARIQGNCTGQINGIGVSCVDLSSAAIEDGSAVFVLCCKKEDNKCMDCSGTVTLDVVDTSNTVVASKEVTVTCKPI